MQKDINAVLGYMEQTGKVHEVEPDAPPEIDAVIQRNCWNPGRLF